MWALPRQLFSEAEATVQARRVMSANAIVTAFRAISGAASRCGSSVTVRWLLSSGIIFLHAFYKHDRKDTEKALETALKILESITDENGIVSEKYRKELIMCD